MKGKWPDSQVNYATQCAARRANWPAQEHWRRVKKLGVEDLTGQEKLRNASHYFLVLTLNFRWFDRDYNNIDCQDSGGSSRCPCTDPPTPTNWLFNTNWYSNIILIPGFVGRTCILLNSTLTPSEYDHCTKFTSRAYDNFTRGANWLTGANTLDVATIGVDGAIPIRRIHGEMVIVSATTADGIRPDGSFGQHAGLLYSGNYGKERSDYTNVVLGLEYASGATQFEAPASAKATFETLIEGDRWMIYRNTLTNILHWDFSVLPRFISFPVVDNQATGSLKMNLTDFKVLGNLWGSQTLLDFEHELVNGTNITPNAGNVVGNRFFYANDYMVQRGNNYVSTLKMFSTRTKNTECTNSQNPFGFHLADGALYTYIHGTEYEDIAASWDWNLIPGITTDYGATPLACNQASFMGVESFVGGASDGAVGVAAMRYTNPLTKAFSFQKAWFFLEEDIQHVIVSNLISKTTAPIISVLDQRRANGTVHIDNTSSPGQTTLFHGGVGYRILDPHNAFFLNHSIHTNVSGDWQLIGTSTQPPTSVDLFTASVTHHSSLDASLEYTIYPGTDLEDSFPRKLRQLELFSIRSDASITALYDKTHATAFIVFWSSMGGSVNFVQEGVNRPFKISTTSSGIVIYKQWSGNVTVGDPSQSLQSMEVTIQMNDAKFWPPKKTFKFVLPQGGQKGKSVSQNLFAE
ncbi:polysaccharide lyase family 8 protein [Flagelloscypha sp. PMI_526]|nr:polysaccharide lyase family 8 protein [Flagelloscypha sp. PMI_526]